MFFLACFFVIPAIQERNKERDWKEKVDAAELQQKIKDADEQLDSLKKALDFKESIQNLQEKLRLSSKQ